MLRLLDALASRRPDSAFARDLAAAARRPLATPAPSAPTAARPEPLVDPLSERELDVLRLLASDLDGPAIARELVVSLNTVRTHTKHIYTKLAVTNRRSAISKARQLGLLGVSGSRALG
jgi:LuxR family maltose regulon positive regulatory protein